MLIDDFDKLTFSEGQKTTLLALFDGATTNRDHIYILNTNKYKQFKEQHATLLRNGRTVVLQFPSPSLAKLQLFNERFCAGMATCKFGDSFSTTLHNYNTSKYNTIMKLALTLLDDGE